MGRWAAEPLMPPASQPIAQPLPEYCHRWAQGHLPRCAGLVELKAFEELLVVFLASLPDEDPVGVARLEAVKARPALCAFLALLLTRQTAALLSRPQLSDLSWRALCAHTITLTACPSGPQSVFHAYYDVPLKQGRMVLRCGPLRDLASLLQRAAAAAPPLVPGGAQHLQLLVGLGDAVACLGAGLLRLNMSACGAAVGRGAPAAAPPAPAAAAAAGGGKEGRQGQGQHESRGAASAGGSSHGMPGPRQLRQLRKRQLACLLQDCLAALPVLAWLASLLVEAPAVQSAVNAAQPAMILSRICSFVTAVGSGLDMTGVYSLFMLDGTTAQAAEGPSQVAAREGLRAAAREALLRLAEKVTQLGALPEVAEQARNAALGSWCLSASEKLGSGIALVGATQLLVGQAARSTPPSQAAGTGEAVAAVAEPHSGPGPSPAGGVGGGAGRGEREGALQALLPQLAALHATAAKLVLRFAALPQLEPPRGYGGQSAGQLLGRALEALGEYLLAVRVCGMALKCPSAGLPEGCSW